MTRQILCYSIFKMILYSCSNKPSEADIKRKIVLDYTCPETIQISSMQVINLKEASSFVGLKGFEYTVSGEVVWKDGCNEFGSSLPIGHKEKFKNKKVILIKGGEGWR